MKKAISILFLFSTFHYASFAAAATNDEIRTKVQEMLSRRAVKTTPEWWRSLGPQAPSVIISMFGSSHRTLEKIRLVEALGFFSSDEAVSFLKTTAGQTNNSPLRQAAIRAVARSQGAKEKDFYTQYLNHNDPHTRLEAARALKQSGDPEAAKTAKRFQTQEKGTWVDKELSSEETKASAAAGKIPPDSQIVRDNQDRQ